jgi:Cys-tRNA(Pro)/Cys-tRNA(Cys) deacylase
MKTNAVRLLENHNIAHELRDYEVDPNDLAAESVAAKIGLPPEQVFKTLVVKGDRNGVCLAVIPGNSELDLKALAKLTGDRKMELAPLKEVQPLTGYIRGGVTALACKKDYPVFVDETAILFDVISVSAGTRGTQILLSPNDYLRVVNATTGGIAPPKQGAEHRSSCRFTRPNIMSFVAIAWTLQLNRRRVGKRPVDHPSENAYNWQNQNASFRSRFASREPERPINSRRHQMAS